MLWKHGIARPLSLCALGAHKQADHHHRATQKELQLISRVTYNTFT